MNGSAEPVGRGVLILVLTGALLGIGFNYLGQKSRPARGLAWISEPKKLDSLEDHIQLGEAPDRGAPPVSEPTGEASQGSTAAAATNGAPVTTATHDEKAATPQAPADAPKQKVDTAKAEPRPTAPSGSQKTPAQAAPPASASTTVADPDDPLGGAVAAAAEGTGVPDIPDLDRPFAVQLPTVKRFFDARAAYIIDARDPEEFAEGHIPGAVNLPFSTAGTDPARLEAIDNGERPIIVYCGGGTCEVSMSLAESLVYQYAKRKVLVYMGGFPEWQSAGYPVQKGKEGLAG